MSQTKPLSTSMRHDCSCSKQRVLEAMTLWGIKDIEEMINEACGENATCQMCGRSYEITLDELKLILDHLKKYQKC